MTIQELARKYGALLITKTRANGDNFLCVEDDYKDEALTKLIYDAHNGMMPDDYKYQFIHEALESISEYNDIYDIQLEPDIYNCDLLKWVSSNLTRMGYVDDALELSGCRTLADALRVAQYAEKMEVLHSVIQSLEVIVSE